jgi:hypothetical protein
MAETESRGKSGEFESGGKVECCFPAEIKSDHDKFLISWFPRCTLYYGETFSPDYFFNFHVFLTFMNFVPVLISIRWEKIIFIKQNIFIKKFFIKNVKFNLAQLESSWANFSMREKQLHRCFQIVYIWKMCTFFRFLRRYRILQKRCKKRCAAAVIHPLS